MNDELSVAAADPALAETLTRAFEDDLTRSKTWSAEEWKRRPLYERVLETFWALFSEIFWDSGRSAAGGSNHPTSA
jgi:phosphatidylserine/phosphatidylglycerophosphate/cardiolipin synthase-like enzyme